jgi:hypothetical protein
VGSPLLPFEAMGANDRLLFRSALDEPNNARWAARTDGGTIHVDAEGKLFKTIEVVPNNSGEDGFLLSSV